MPTTRPFYRQAQALRRQGLIETCKLDGINPQAYLTDVFTHIVLRGNANPIDDLLPYNWVDSRAATNTAIERAA